MFPSVVQPAGPALAGFAADPFADRGPGCGPRQGRCSSPEHNSLAAGMAAVAVALCDGSLGAWVGVQQPRDSKSSLPSRG